MHHYRKKQFGIVVIFIFILVILGLGGYFLFRGEEPTCFDGIQNQGEKEIDCGGPCGLCPEDTRKPLEIIFQNFIHTTENNFDLVAKIKNPNKLWGVESLVYRFNLYDENNNLIVFKQGEEFILPQEDKYIIESRFYLLKTPARSEFEIMSINWQKLKDFEGLELKVRDKNYQITDQGFSRLYGIVENKSNYSLDKIDITGLLLSDEKIIAVGKTDIRTVIVGQSRHFEINWPYEVEEEVLSFEIRAHANIYLNETFIKRHGTQEKFKEY